ncbi:hypothetical protein PFICI_15008 [Pestalotiopsis fici W106-1]|uniref:F-box domain-containing protein n=1 Tax=Pestalotiopsis fici (strain W106-1 / CGMCC3.15140) TaxID=1229662 RepID=W3WHN2_PESFW|nr:uncharacterized protein PFICI_15008 [Pestalotiopsis fici W106-1]ETS73403.1 hypothetical protein PFICI_15008 [Pestalotiopsis fici W106-1]
MACWASLPAELAQEIVHLALEADADSAPKFATISRVWQIFVEQKTFSSIRIRSTQVPELHNMMTPFRQSLVRNINFEVILAEYDMKRCKEKETEEEQEQNSRSFTVGMFQLFDHLATWTSMSGGKAEQQPRVSLKVSSSSPSDSQSDTPLVGSVACAKRRWRWGTSILELVQDDKRNLPLLLGISEFLCDKNYYPCRKISLKACCDIFARLPNVQTLEFYSPDDGGSRLPRDFIAGLQMIPNSVRHVTLLHSRHDRGAVPWGFRPHPGNSWAPGPLSVALYHLARRLVKLDIDSDCIYPEFFWPVSAMMISSRSPEQPLYFPYLEEIRFGKLNVSSSQVFKGPNLRFKYPFDIYLLATAQVVREMPRLKRCVIEWDFRALYQGLEYQIFRDGAPRALLTVWGEPPIPLSGRVKNAWLRTTEVLLGSRDKMEVKLRDDIERDPHLDKVDPITFTSYTT